MADAHMEMQLAYIEKSKINADLLAALEEIAKGEGVFSLDQLTHANNTIENMQKIALDAIAKSEASR